MEVPSYSILHRRDEAPNSPSAAKNVNIAMIAASFVFYCLRLWIKFRAKAQRNLEDLFLHLAFVRIILYIPYIHVIGH
jgi:hypothetical protein